MLVWPVSTSHIWDLPKTPTVYWQLHSSRRSPKKPGPRGVVALCEIILTARKQNNLENVIDNNNNNNNPYI